MPTKRRKLGAQRIGLSARAIEAWQAGVFHDLNRALGVRPWQMTPWPLRLTALGVDPDQPPPDDGRPWNASWQRAVDLQRALLEVAGQPLLPTRI